ncbi:MAG: hypothetical protein R3A79_17210 [Nannocystaceae bacterium]
MAWRDRSGVAAVALLHLGLLVVFIDPELWLAGRPLPNVDFHTHATQTWRVLEGLAGWGRSWVYDVQLLAGQPTGAIFDADNKAWELWTYALTTLGVERAAAFNSFALVAHLAVVPAVYAAARLFDLRPARATLASLLAVLLWWFDAWFHWCWWIGMVAYAAASVLALLPLALFYRFTEDRRPRQAVACAVALALTLLVHPYAFFALAPPMLALWWRARRRLRPVDHAAVVAIAGLAIAANAYWLVVAARFWHYILDSAIYGQARLSILGADLFEWLLEPETTGLIGARTTFRWLTLALAVLGLVAWRRRGDRRFVPFAVGLGCLGALAYLGGYSALTGQIQPYRHVAPLAMLATIPAAERFAELFAGRPWRSWPRSAKVAVGLALLPAAQHVVAETTYYTYGLLPQPQPPSLSRQRWIIGSSGFIRPPDYRLLEEDPALVDLQDWVRAHDDGQARFLVELGHLGEALAWGTDAQVIGGFTHRNLAHSRANLYRRYPTGALAPAPLRAYLDTYAIGWIVTTPPAPWLESPAYAEIVERAASFGPHVVYRVKSPAPLIKSGGGAVTAATNAIAVRGADPAVDLVLRFHWMETLACVPGCRIERAAIGDDDPVGFIRVPAPHPADLEIVNTYEVQR